MANAENRRDIQSLQEIEPDLEAEITRYLKDVQGLFSTLPNMQAIRLQNPDKTPFTLTPITDPETVEWKCLRTEPNRLNPHQPTIYTISPEHVIVTFASIQAENDSGIGRSQRDKFEFAKAKIETIIAPIRIKLAEKQTS